MTGSELSLNPHSVPKAGCGAHQALNEFCCCSVTKLHLALFDPINGSMTGSSVLHYLLAFAEIHIH